MLRRPSTRLREGLSIYWLLVRIAENLRRLNHPGSYRLFRSIRLSLGMIRHRSKNKRASFERAGQKWLGQAAKIFSTYITEQCRELSLLTKFDAVIDLLCVRQKQAKEYWDTGDKIAAFEILVKAIAKIQRAHSYHALIRQYLAMDPKGSVDDCPVTSNGIYTKICQIRIAINRLSGKSPIFQLKTPGPAAKDIIIDRRAIVQSIVGRCKPADREHFKKLKQSLIRLGKGHELSRFYRMIVDDYYLKRALEEMEARVNELTPKKDPMIFPKWRKVGTTTTLEANQPVEILVKTVEVTPPPPDPLEIEFQEISAPARELMEAIKAGCPGLYQDQTRLIQVARHQYLSSKGKPGPKKDATSKLDAICRRCREYQEQEKSPAKATVTPEQPKAAARITVTAQPGNPSSRTRSPHRKMSRGEARRGARAFVNEEK